MTREETLEAIKVMQHYADGGDVEVVGGEEYYGYDNQEDGPIWDWKDDITSYRIKPAEKKRIKLEAWISDVGELRWLTENHFGRMDGFWHRVPSEDKWVEVEE